MVEKACAYVCVCVVNGNLRADETFAVLRTLSSWYVDLFFFISFSFFRLNKDEFNSHGGVVRVSP